MKLSIKASGYRVIVKPKDVDNISPGGIHLAHNENLEKAGRMVGTLVSVGPTAWKNYSDKYDKYVGEPWAQEGDEVHYSRYAGKGIRDPENPDVELFILNDEDIVAVGVN